MVYQSQLEFPVWLSQIVCPAENVEETPMIFENVGTYGNWVQNSITQDDFQGPAFSEALNANLPFNLVPANILLAGRSRESLTGTWRTLHLTLTCPIKSCGISDMSFVGAIFGSCLFRCYKDLSVMPALTESQAIFLELLRYWVEKVPRSENDPEYYETNCLTVTFLGQDGQIRRAASLSRVNGMTMRDYYVALSNFTGRVMTIEQQAASAGASKDEVDELEAKLFMSEIFAGKKLLAEVTQSDNSMESSDSAWTNAEMHPDSLSVTCKVTLHFAKFFPKIGAVPTGCKLSKDDTQFLRFFSKDNRKATLLLYNPSGIDPETGSGSNCFLECLVFHLMSNHRENDAEVFKNSSIFKELAPHLVDIKDKDLISRICITFKFAITACVENGAGGFESYDVFSPAVTELPTLKLLAYRNNPKTTAIPLSWHVMVISDTTAVLKRVKCAVCKDFFLEKSIHFENCVRCPDCHKCYSKQGQHYLSCKQVPFKTKQPGSGANRGLRIKAAKSEEWQLTKNIWFCDFESFPAKDGTHIPYLICLKEIDNASSMKSFYGKTCLREFANFIMRGKTVAGYLFCHNGSGYDFNLILLALLENGWIPKEGLQILSRGTKILTAQIKTTPVSLTLRDSYLYLPSSLARLCKDFKIPQSFSKAAFDHSKIKSFKDFGKHMKECIDYCKLDVLALEEIYKKFAAGLWKVTPVLLPQNMSLASHAFEMWKHMENAAVIRSIELPDLATYKLLRQMYHGGRTLCTVKKYDSHVLELIAEMNEDGESLFYDGEALSYDTWGNICYTFDNTPADKCSELKLVDVVSLYPFCMFKFQYPVGKFVGTRDVLQNDQEKIADHMSNTINGGKWYAIAEEDLFEGIKVENSEYSSLKSAMFKSCYQVDMDCPQDIFVAFVMRKEDDAPVQNLKKLRNFWITGVELFEAIKIGYKLLRVKKIMSWERSAPIFKKYIETLFKIKEEHKADKSNVMYIVAKLLMNALSGKFGQKIVSKVVTLLNDLPEDPDSLFKDLKNIEEQVVEHKNQETGETEPVGYVFTGEKSEDDLKTNLPTQLSVFILAYARRVMSKMLRKVNGYKDEKHTLLYTDTDSMVVRKETYELLKKHGFIGHALGQLEDEFPDARIFAGRFLAPKTYCLAMFKQVEGRAACAYKVRCKGIPHRGDIFFARDYQVAEESLEVQVKNVESSISGPVIDLATRFYVVKKKKDDSVSLVHPFINLSICDDILDKETYLQVHFGSISKSRDKTKKFHVKSTWIQRSLGFNSWWDGPNCPRISTSNPYQVTKCRGEGPVAQNQEHDDALQDWFNEEGMGVDV